MRVITGIARGMRLNTLEGDDVTRPTGEKVKEALFSMIQFEIEGSRVIDLFAGSGQLGIEALSRGAESCVFCDKNMDAFKLIKENLQHTKLFKQSKVVCCDYNDALRSGTYDIAFVDPPYSKGIIDDVLPKLVPRMSDSGVIICECSEYDEIPENAGEFTLTDRRRYGKTSVALYRKKEL